jgi:hypothetical protein
MHGHKMGHKTGVAMWELLAFGAATVLVPMVVVLILFRLASLKRAKDVEPAPHELTLSRELRAPE